jgi:hypothetical protein
MTSIIDPETIQVDQLPTIWSPVQWELNPDEKAQELEQQATASLLWAANAPETILRLLLNETAIERAYEPPEGYDPEQQGDWIENLLTFTFRRTIELKEIRRERDQLSAIYKFDELGYWQIEITPEKMTIERI